MLAAALLVALANAAQSFPYLDELRQYEQLVAERPESGTARNFALMMRAYAQSYVDASANVGVSYYGLVDDSPSPPALPALLADHEPRDALASIVDAARDRQIVIINEAHVMPRHRAFATRLARELRRLGFGYLAVETLDNRTPGIVERLQARGYPLVEDGYYSKEPLFGDLLRQSLRAGYRLVAYEFTAFDEAYEKLDAAEQQTRREDTQAQNIIDRVLAKDPRARILVYVGHGHVSEQPVEIDGRQVDMLAASLRRKSGIDPLCIEQTRSSFPAQIAVDGPLTDAVLRDFEGESFVLARRDGGGYWNRGHVDITVWHRPEALRQGRPDWMSMRGYRRPMPIPAELLPREGRRLVQAFVAGEAADAVPMDQVLVTAGEPAPVFMLPRGKYRFAFQD